MKSVKVWFVVSAMVLGFCFGCKTQPSKSEPHPIEETPSRTVQEPVKETASEQVYVNSDVFFQLNSVDKETGLKHVQFALDGADFMLYKNSFQILTEGKHDISYRAFDNSSNLEVAKTFTVIVDNTAPKAVVETDKPIYTNGLVQYCSAQTK